MLVNLPNLITMGRLISVPIVVWMILTKQMTPALILFAIAGVSDALDGFLARAFKSRTQLGAYLDPIADKALLVGTFLALGVRGHIELWVVILVIFRDIMIVGGILLLFLMRKPTEMNPLMISKINTVAQLLFLFYIMCFLSLGWGSEQISTILGYIIAITTVLSGGAYVKLLLEKI